MTSKSLFRVTVFNACLYIILIQLENRCEGFKNVYSQFHIPNSTVYLKAQKAEIINKAEELIQKYPDGLTGIG